MKNAYSKNRVLQCGLSWRLLNSTTTPWAKLLILKYGNKRYNSSSFIWKSVLKGCKTCSQGIQWLIGKNSNLNIWETR